MDLMIPLCAGQIAARFGFALAVAFPVGFGNFARNFHTPENARAEGGKTRKRKTKTTQKSGFLFGAPSAYLCHHWSPDVCLVAWIWYYAVALVRWFTLGFLVLLVFLSPLGLV